MGTARVADITNAGTSSGNTISGTVSIERYIPAKRAWRLLSAPVCSCSPPTINAAWQEGVTAGNPSAGYGTQITGGTMANGYDQGVNFNPSLKVFSNSSNSFTGLPVVPGTNTAITSYPGYFLFVRGDRGTNLAAGVNATPSPTTLRMRGTVNMGNMPTAVNAANFTLAGNPYPAAIDFHSLTKSNVNDKVYLWDPKLTGSGGLGGYVTLVWNAGNGAYDATTAVSPVSRYIPSGEAFFVESLNGTGAGTLTIKETDKNTGGSDQVFRPMGSSEQLRVNLFGVASDSTEYLTDGVLTTYSDNNSNAVDRDDAKKLYNLAENITIGRAGQMLAIERRHTIEGDDTTFLNLYTVKQQRYKLELTAGAMDNLGLYGLLKDNYSAAINNTPLNLSGLTEIYFKVNGDAGSYAPNRFSIVFSKLAPLAVRFVLVKAYVKQKDIAVEWSTANELNIASYQVESSADGNNFTAAYSEPAKANNGAGASYSWLDVHASAGLHYFRVSSTDINGKTSYSQVVTVRMEKSAAEPGIAVYSNSIAGNQVAVHFNNIEKGSYSLQLYTMEGQLLKKQQVTHAGGAVSIYTLKLTNYLPAGEYQMQLTGKTIKLVTGFIKQ